MFEKSNSKIEQLKKSLYSRSNGPDEVKRKGKLRERDFDVEENWHHEEEPMPEPDLFEKEESNFMKKIFLGSIIFFIAALLLGALIVFKGSNVVSADNVDIKVVGPVSTAGGAELSLDIEVQNNNNIKLELVDLFVEFPEGTANPGNITEELKRFRESMGDIESHESAVKTVKAVMFGEENSKKEIRITAEYRVQGSNAIFVKEKIYEVFISSSPVTLSVGSFKEVNAGQEMEVTVTVTSNSATPLKNLLVRGEYPFGFSFIRANPAPSFDNNVWKLGDLPPQTKRTIVLRGKIEGQDEENRIFRFNLGIQSAKNEKQIGTAFVSASQDITVKKPFIGVELALDGDTSNNDHVVELGRAVRADVVWVNNLDTSIADVEILVKLRGSTIDKTAVAVDSGFYRSYDDTIVWDKTNTPSLELLRPGEEGRVSFTFTPRDPSGVTGAALKNPEIYLDVSVKSTRLSENDVPESIASTLRRRAKVASAAYFSSEALYSVGPFKNTGPLPPRAENETTYTVVWTITNTSSSIADAKVKASLPSYVKFLNKLSPSGEKISYNPVGGEVVWTAGTISAGAKKEVAFQISFTPSVSQLGMVPVLVNGSEFTAEDQFTGAVLRSTNAALTTRLTTDPNFDNGEDQVSR
jgi:hypothetical protein